MSSTDAFALLGLTRGTATQGDVRAAYARLLKVTRPEDDRAAFMALRRAFEEARAVAPAGDAAPVAEAPETMPEKGPERAPKVETLPPPPQTVWRFDADLNRHFDDSPGDRLVEETIRWMIAGGPDAPRFTARIAETLLLSPDIDAAAFHAAVVEFIATAADPDLHRQHAEPWEALAGTRPAWLDDALIAALHGGLGLLRTRPEDTCAVRDYNTVLGLFAPVAERGIDADAAPLPPPLDLEEAYARGEAEGRADDHGSYFDREAREWVDLSPVGVAMRDLVAAFDANLWTMVEECRAILRREEVQSLDEFQALDARLRGHVCFATGWGTGAPHPTCPAWLSRPLMALLDETFGWSRHYGRAWEREQYDWLHRIIDRDGAAFSQGTRARTRPAPSASQAWTVDVPPAPPSDLARALAFLFGRPAHLVIGYAGYRAMQVLWRLAT